MCPLQERCMTAKFIQVNKVELSHLTRITFLYTLHKHTFFYRTVLTVLSLTTVTQLQNTVLQHPTTIPEQP